MTNNYIYIENYGGIYAPDIKNLMYNITSNNFLEIYFIHGMNIINERYIYYIFPKVDKNNFEKYVNNFEILVDSINITAVKNKLNNIKEYVFLEQGSFDGIKVDNPCIIILYENKNEIYIYCRPFSKYR